MENLSGSMERVYVDRDKRYPTQNNVIPYSLPNMQQGMYGAKGSHLIHWSQLIHHKTTCYSATVSETGQRPGETGAIRRQDAQRIATMTCDEFETWKGCKILLLYLLMIREPFGLLNACGCVKMLFEAVAIEEMMMLQDAVLSLACVLSGTCRVLAAGSISITAPILTGTVGKMRSFDACSEDFSNCSIQIIDKSEKLFV